MIWATVSSQSCFCWLYRASPSLAAKNRISLILSLTIWWCPCVVFSCVVGRGCLLWPVGSLGKTLLAFALLHSVLQGQICLSLQGFLDFLLYPGKNFMSAGFPDSSVGKESTCNAGDPSSVPGLGRSAGEGIGYPLQCSCLPLWLSW